MKYLLGVLNGQTPWAMLDSIQQELFTEQPYIKLKPQPY